ncbi:MAG: hypothetical protein JWL73_1861 [Actinomycetia bacterium]|jgi:hypothetical protein|nr:hypothetical protein [Actinomycetes bacterium]
MEREVLRGILLGLDRDRACGRDPGVRLLSACVDVLGINGAGITLMVGDENRGSLGGSDETIRIVEELQFSLGEGPCVDTHRSGRPVLEPRLADPSMLRWPQFSAPAIEAGVQAIFGFPLVVGTTGIGALDVYSDQPGELRPTQYRDALVMANIVTHAVLEIQAEADPGSLSPQLDDAVILRTVVHQATGMLSVQLDVTIPDALACLRAYAYAESRPIDAVAKAVVERRLRID